jgi:4-aminobutyrate aminotransferase-like enzyme
VHTLSTSDCHERPDWLGVFEPPCQYHIAVDGDPLEGYVGSVRNAIATLIQNDHQPAGIMIDSIFDCQGTIVSPEGYFEQVYQTVREAGGLVIADEVQSGYCRTGKWWGFDHDQVVPDIVTLGKPMGAGHPLAAVVTTPEIAAKFANKTTYFNTFGGNPVSAAIGKAVIEVIDSEGLLENVANVGAYTRTGLDKLMDKFPVIGDVRGRGLFLSIELVKDRQSKTPDVEATNKIANLMKDEGVILSTHGRYENSLKIRPPLVFNQDNADQLLAALEVCFNQI